jgi:hypothetical protein
MEELQMRENRISMARLDELCDPLKMEDPPVKYTHLETAMSVSHITSHQRAVLHVLAGTLHYIRCFSSMSGR